MISTPIPRNMLIDSNIIIYSINTASPKHKKAQKFLQDNIHELIVSHQTILESIRVLTHPKFERPMTSLAAISAVYIISEVCRVIYPDYKTLSIAVELMKKHKLVGNRIFDAYFAATALANDIDTIATDNVKDFLKLTQIKIINPFA